MTIISHHCTFLSVDTPLHLSIISTWSSHIHDIFFTSIYASSNHFSVYYELFYFFLCSGCVACAFMESRDITFYELHCFSGVRRFINLLLANYNKNLKTINVSHVDVLTLSFHNKITTNDGYFLQELPNSLQPPQSNTYKTQIYALEHVQHISHLGPPKNDPSSPA